MGDSVVDAYGFMEVFGLIMSFVGIILILVIAYFGSRWVAGRVSQSVNGSKIKIVDRAILGQDRYLAVAKVGEKCYLLGVTPQSISMLTQLDEEDFPDLPTTPSNTPPFGEMLKKVQEMGFTGKVRSKKDDVGS